MTVYNNNNNLISSNVAIDGELVVKYDKSGKNIFKYVDYGLSIFKKSTLDSFSTKQNLDLDDLNQKLISMNQLVAFEVRQRFYEIGSFQGIKELEKYLQDK
jgi:hypothetical protein